MDWTETGLELDRNVGGGLDRSGLAWTGLDWAGQDSGQDWTGSRTVLETDGTPLGNRIFIVCPFLQTISFWSGGHRWKNRGR